MTAVRKEEKITWQKSSVVYAFSLLLGFSITTHIYQLACNLTFAIVQVAAPFCDADSTTIKHSGCLLHTSKYMRLSGTASLICIILQEQGNALGLCVAHNGANMLLPHWHSDQF